MKKQQHAGVPGSAVSVLSRGWETFLYFLKAGPAGGRLRRLGRRKVYPLDVQRLADGGALRTAPAVIPIG